MNEVQGLCSRCGRPGRMHTCRLCGALVCDACFDPMNQVCKSCKRP